MPTTGGKTFQIDSSAFDDLAKKFTDRLNNDDKAIKKRITQATGMVWQIAHQKRPMKGGVSDPNARAGVPVRTGALQASVTQSVSRKGLMSYQGIISAKGVDYMGYMEYGTSKIQARPFMRPAVNLTQDAIKRLMGLQIEDNL